MKIKIILLLLLFCAGAGAQEKIVPLSLDVFFWPVNIPALDTVYYYEAKTLSSNKVKIREEINEDGKTIFKLYYDKKGFCLKKEFNENDSIGYINTYERNSDGQITEEFLSAYIRENNNRITINSLKRISYDCNNPIEYKRVDNKSSITTLHASYENNILKSVLFSGDTKVIRYNGNDKYIIKLPGDTLGTITQRNDTVIISIPRFSKIIYNIKKNNIISTSHITGTEFDNYYYYYNAQGLLQKLNIFISKIDSNGQIVKENTKHIYKYTYYEY